MIFPTLKLKLKPELLEKKEKPRFLLANEKSLFDNFLELLQNESEEIVGKVWEIIEDLTPNEEYAKKLDILELEDASPENWGNYLGFKTKHDSSLISYITFLLSEILDIKKNTAEKINEYEEKFKEKKGFKFVVSLFVQTLKQPKTKINTKCLIYSMKVINSLLDQSKVKLYFSTPQEEQAIWEEVWKLMNSICQKHANKIEDKTMDENEEAELIGNCFNLHMILVVGDSETFSQSFNLSEYLQPLKSGIIASSKYL